MRAIAFAAPLVISAPLARAQCSCTCDANVPSNQQINAALLNEDGGGPTHFVSAGGPGGSAREVRHGNLFAGGGITITHVCIALQSPSGQPGEIANIQLYQPDPDPINMNLPGAMFYNQQFQVNASFNGHQIVQLVTPQTPSNFWVVVAYPTAQPAIGHQGTRPRTQGNSAVYIGGPPGPGFTPGWKYYDDIGGPGGTAGYLGNAPIIRPLNIGPSSSVCPYDQQCCNTVCGIDPSCCITWHPLCGQLALANCFPAGCATCPPTGVSENEACDADVNGGCDTNGVFSTLQCNTTVCGTLWRHSVLSVTDSDWYRIDVVDTDGSGQAFFTFNVESEAPVEVLLQNDFCPNDLPYVIYTGSNVQPCIPAVFGGAVPSPGTYRISVRSTGTVNQCPQQSDYTLRVDVDDCPGVVPPPRNDSCANAGLVILNPGTFTFITDGATTDGPARPCGFNGVNDADVWFTYIAPCDGTATFSLTSSFDHLLAVYTDCPLAGGVLVGCGAGSGPLPAVVTFQAVAGQGYVVRAGGLNGATGTATLQVDFVSCTGDIAPQPGGNCTVNIDDLLMVINNWGACTAPCPRYCNGDVTQNCAVNIDDLLAVINLWGPCP
jgi:hypothetical protein